MNNFFDNIGKAAKDAAKIAAKTSESVVEITKNTVNMKFDEAKRDNFFKEIGKIVYKAYRADSLNIDPDIGDFCRCIDEIEKSIEISKTRIAKIKGQKFCVACGQKLEIKSAYCPSCGVKQPEIEHDEECSCGCGCCADEENEEDCGCGCSEDSCCGEESDCCSDDSCCGEENDCCSDDSCCNEKENNCCSEDSCKSDDKI